MGRVAKMEGRIVMLPPQHQDKVRVWLRTATESENVLVAHRAMQCASLVMARYGLNP